MKSHRFVSFAGLAGVLLAAIFISHFGHNSSKAQDERDQIIKSRRQQPGTDTGTYSPQMHQLYDGKFHLTADKIHMVGRLNDEPGWPLPVPQARQGPKVRNCGWVRHQPVPSRRPRTQASPG